MHSTRTAAQEAVSDCGIHCCTGVFSWDNSTGIRLAGVQEPGGQKLCALYQNRIRRWCRVFRSIHTGASGCSGSAALS